MNNKRIKFYPISGGQTGYIGIEITSYKKPVVWIELFDNCKENPNIEFAIHIKQWNKIVKFIEEELKELGG